MTNPKAINDAPPHAHLQPAQQPITEDDAFIAAALEHASVPTLMMSMIHMTGDAGLLRGAIKPHTAVLGEIQGYLEPEQQSQVRRQALEVVKQYRDRGCTLPELPVPDVIRRMMSFLVGQTVPEEYVPMMLEEMNLAGHDSRSLHWRRPVSRQKRERFKVIVIGAGLGGLLAGIRLGEAGIPYAIYEKNAAIGGTWHENTYPGARVDTPNHFYCYSFAPNHDWPHHYSTQPELLAYFQRCARDYGVSPHIHLNTAVSDAVYDPVAKLWRVTVRCEDGTAQTLSANAVISATGQLNRPKIPDFVGRERFQGPQFHSAAYQHEHDLNGKRIAVIGTGASAFQLVPALVDRVGKMIVFQRSPPWMFPNPDYHAAVPEAVKWLFKHLPYYARWYRFLLFWPASDGLLPSLVKDPQWAHPQRAVCESNDNSRIVMTEWIDSQIVDHPELREKVLPRYPPFVKRMLQDNGSWLTALQKENAELVTDAITAIDAQGVICGDERHDVDVIIYATGFNNHRWLYPMNIIGRSGKPLADVWGDDPQANLGITVPDYPNFFCVYGPATNLAHAGSLVFNSECQVRYIMECIRALLENDCRSIECKVEAARDYHQRLRDWVGQLVWSHEGTDSWYKNSEGRVTANMPWRLVDYWRWTRKPNLNEYHLG